MAGNFGVSLYRGPLVSQLIANKRAQSKLRFQCISNYTVEAPFPTPLVRSPGAQQNLGALRHNVHICNLSKFIDSTLCLLSKRICLPALRLDRRTTSTQSAFSPSSYFMTRVVSLVAETRRQSHSFETSTLETINNTAVAAQLLCFPESINSSDTGHRCHLRQLRRHRVLD